MNTVFRHHEKIILAALTAAVFVTLWGEAAESVVKKDLDGDGHAEAEIHYAGRRRIEKMLVDSDRDGKPDRVYFYREGVRDRAELDSDLDGRTDVWVSYDPGGDRWKTAFDLSKKGRADYWRFFKEGIVYRWERDRNLDGKPDRRTILTNGTGHAGPRSPFLKRAYDDDFDGVFERTSGNVKPPEPPPMSLAEARYRR